MVLRSLKSGAGYIGKSLANKAKELAGKDLDFEYFFWEVTDACNSRCSHCHIWQHDPRKDVLTLDEIEELFASGFFKNVNEVIISGGEPVLLPYLREALLIMHKYIKQDARVSLSTNGLLPDKVLSVTKDCLDAGMNITVGVSLDGAGEHHDAIRGVQGNFRKVDYLMTELLKLRSLEKYKKSLNVCLGFTLSPLTEAYLLEVQQYAQEHGLDFSPQVYENFSYYSNANKKEEEYTPQILDKVKALYPNFQKEVILGCLNKTPIRFRCCGMEKFFVLHCNGDISPCLKFAHINGGNIRGINIRKIKSDPGFLNARKIVKNCQGCSNTWGTGWNIRYWIFPFLGKLLSSSVKKFTWHKKRS